MPLWEPFIYGGGATILSELILRKKGLPLLNSHIFHSSYQGADGPVHHKLLNRGRKQGRNGDHLELGPVPLTHGDRVGDKHLQ